MTAPNRVTSTSSERITRIRALHSRAGRRKAGLFVVEGPQAVRSAIDAGVPVHDLFADEAAGVAVSDLVAIAERSRIRVTHVTPSVMAAMAETQQPQGLLATCSLLPEGDLGAVMAAAGPVVVLESVSDPGNVGTIIRTCDAVAAAGVILSGTSVDVHNGKVVRSTAGSLFHVPVISGRSVAEVAAAARAAGRNVAVTLGDGATDLFVAADSGVVSDRTCWVIGSEAHGASDEARAAADLEVAIPMTGRTESLNAAVAAAIVLYVTRHAESRLVRGDGRMTD